MKLDIATMDAVKAMLRESIRIKALGHYQDAAETHGRRSWTMTSPVIMTLSAEEDAFVLVRDITQEKATEIENDILGVIDSWADRIMKEYAEDHGDDG